MRTLAVVLLVGVICVAGGFYAGINVEKGQLASASTASAPGGAGLPLTIK